MIRTRILCFAGLAALALAGPALAEIAYPVDRAGTAGQWAIWYDADGFGAGDQGAVFRRGVSWPVADGGPIQGLDPHYAYLLMVRSEPPAIDERLQAIAYPCPESPDFAASTLATTCTAAVRSAAELVAAVRNEAATRKAAVLAAYGIQSPSDQTRALALLIAERGGQQVGEADADWLNDLGAVGLDYLDAIDDRAAEIEAWIIAHPGEIPAIGDAEWPALPVAWD